LEDIKMAKLTIEEILAYMEEATILELNELVKAIEEKFDVTAAAPVAVAAAAEVVDAGPVNVTVTLTSAGDKKVAVIKAVREITGLGLVEAKGLVDKLPAEIKKDIPAEEAAKLKEQLEAAGASVEVK
jgi:large subunit ribosomal protein L7/L12